MIFIKMSNPEEVFKVPEGYCVEISSEPSITYGPYRINEDVSGGICKVIVYRNLDHQYRKCLPVQHVVYVGEFELTDLNGKNSIEFMAKINEGIEQIVNEEMKKKCKNCSITASPVHLQGEPVYVDLNETEED